MSRELVDKLLKAKEEYYKGNSIMTDEEFDSLESELRRIDPKSRYFSIVGTPVKDKKKIKHRRRMKSMQKGHSAKDMNKWLKKIGVNITAGIVKMPKIDGLAATVKYSGGTLDYVATRGDGIEGQDITHIADYIKTIPKTIGWSNKEIEIRGELYLPKSTTFDTKGKPLRNNAVGLINRKSDREEVKHVKFVTYAIEEKHCSRRTILEDLRFLMNKGFHVVEYEIIQDIQESYDNYLGVKRDEWDYETDGLVLFVNQKHLHPMINSKWEENDHHDFFSCALKPPSESKETKLLDIVWQMSRQGNLVPVSIFEPIEIGGAIIERATLNNYENVQDLQLAKGDSITISKANDVIPFFKEIVTRSGNDPEELLPKTCPHCNTKLIRKGVHIHCPNHNCTEQAIQRIIYWVKEADIDGVAEGMLRTIYDNTWLEDAADLYQLEKHNLFAIPGLGDSKIKTFLEGMKQDRTITPIKLLSRLNIELVRTKALKKLNINTIQDFRDFNNASSAIGKNVIKWKENKNNIELLDKLEEIMYIQDEEAKKAVLGKVCATGACSLKRKDLINLIEEKGYEWSSSVAKDLSILLTDDINGTSSKLVKAKKNGITIMLYEEFLNDKVMENT